jgi:hypothetical protein
LSLSRLVLRSATNSTKPSKSAYSLISAKHRGASLIKQNAHRPPEVEAGLVINNWDRDCAWALSDGWRRPDLGCLRRTLGYCPSRWSTWRRFEPSSSPSATRPSVQASASTNRPKIPEQKVGFSRIMAVLEIADFWHNWSGEGIFLQSFVLRRFSTV